MKEWRVRTAQAAKAFKFSKRSQRTLKMADLLSKVLVQYCHHGRYATKERDKASFDIREICEAANDLALLFRCNKTEYQWEQKLELLPSLDTKELEILGTEGPDLNQPHQVSRIVFGGVVRGDRTTGLLKDGQTRISKTSVLIGSC